MFLLIYHQPPLEMNHLRSFARQTIFNANFKSSDLNAAIILQGHCARISPKLWRPLFIQAALRDELQVKPENKLVYNINRGDPIPHNVLKLISVEYHGVPSERFSSDMLWYPVFRSPYIKLIRRIIKGKILLTGVTFYVCASKLIQMKPDSIVFLGLASILGFLQVGSFFRKLVCQVYVSEDVEYIRFCRFSFFGNRIDMILPKSLVKPLVETNPRLSNFVLEMEYVPPENIDNSYDNIEFYEQKFLIPIIFGGVIDEERLKKALGNYKIDKFRR